MDLERKLRNDVKSGLKYAEQLLLPDGCSSIQQFKQYCMKRSYIGCCSENWTTNTLIVQCKTCSLTESSCYCLQCFIDGNHEGHEVILRQGNSGVCDCGDYSSVKPEGFCPRHKGTIDDPDERTTQTIRSSFESVFPIVGKVLGDTFPSENTPIIIKWFLQFLEYGDSQKRFVVNAILDGKCSLNTMLNRAINQTDGSMQMIVSFVYELITDTKLKQWVANFLFNSADKYCSAFKSFIKSGNQAKLLPYRQIFEFSVQVNSSPIYSSKFIAEDKYFPTQLNVLHNIIADMNRTKNGWNNRDSIVELNQYIYSISYVTEYPRIAKMIAYDLPKTRQSILQFLKDIQWGQPITRIAVGEHVPYNTNSYIFFRDFISSTSLLFKNFYRGIKLINSQLDNSSQMETEIKKLDNSLTEESKDKVFKILLETKIMLDEWISKREDGFDALSNQLSIFIPLNDHFFKILLMMIRYFNIPIEEIMEKMGIDSLLPYVKYYFTVIAAVVYSVGTSAFARNDDSFRVTCAILTSNAFNLTQYLDYFRYILLALRIEPNIDLFLDSIIEAFGLKEFLASGKVPENIESNQLVTLLCRQFIQLLSDQAEPINFSKERFSYMHSIHSFYNNPSSLNDTFKSTFMKKNVLSRIRKIMKEISSSKIVNGNRVYKLLPEYEAQCSPFYVPYSTVRFYQEFSNTFDIKSPSLIPIPKVGSCTSFIKSKVILNFIHRSLEIFSNSNEEDSTTMITMFALIHMATNASTDSEFIQGLIENKSFELLVSLSQNSKYKDQIQPPLISLFEIIISKFADTQAALNPYREQLIAERQQTIRKQRPNRDAILAKFQSNLNSFANSHADELNELDFSEDEDDNELKCVICRGTIDTKKDNYCLLAQIKSMNSLYLCSHYAHAQCKSETFCPLCKNLTNLYVPIVEGRATEAKLAFLEECNQSKYHPHFSDIPEIITNMLIKHEALIAFDPDYQIQQHEIKAIRSLINILRITTKNSNYLAQYLIHACEIQSYDDFSAKWKNQLCSKNPEIERALVLAINIDSGKDVIDMKMVKNGIDKHFYLDDLPNSYADLFMKIGIKALKSCDDGVCVCLLCGKFLSIGITEKSLPLAIHHCCQNQPPLLVLTGMLSTSVVMKHPFQNKLFFKDTLYDTEEGDQDIGLNLGSFLVLSKDKQRKLKLQVLDGSFNIVRKEDTSLG